MSTQQLLCRGCSRRLGRRAKGLLVAEAFVLCNACADDVRAHRRLYNCPVAHTPRQHGAGAVVTTGRAREALSGAHSGQRPDGWPSRSRATTPKLK